ncbi:hypothetical protein [Paenibacillus sp. OK060]|uniref:hypothetical protein n=1 Tax=Paenibacillus sp. OK060 TaxID=1881034 RepID=UPI00159F78B8|nr:hypothetical protein [Paenibacillus sp. OK060]
MVEIKEQLDRIEGKLDELLNRIGKSPLEKKHSDRTSKESEISLKGLNERLNKLI